MWAWYAQAFARRIVFAFLADIRERFFSQFGDSAHSAVAYEYNTDFSHVLHDRGVFFTENPRADTINRVRGELAEVKNIMVENIEKVSPPTACVPFLQESYSLTESPQSSICMSVNSVHCEGSTMCITSQVWILTYENVTCASTADKRKFLSCCHPSSMSALVYIVQAAISDLWRQMYVTIFWRTDLGFKRFRCWTEESASSCWWTRQIICSRSHSCSGVRHGS